MPYYSLNWTASFSAIQVVNGVNNAARPPESDIKVVFFVVLELKIVYYNNYQSLDKREENILRQCLFRDKFS